MMRPPPHIACTHHLCCDLKSNTDINFVCVTFQIATLYMPLSIGVSVLGLHLFCLQSRLCQCDGRVFIRAAACGIPLLAARIS